MFSDIINTFDSLKALWYSIDNRHAKNKNDPAKTAYIS